MVLTFHTSSPPFLASLSSQACPSLPDKHSGSCVCQLFPTITFNYGSLQCGLVKGLAIRCSLSLSLLVLESRQALCENDPVRPPARFTHPTAHFTSPTILPNQHFVNSHLLPPLWLFSPPPTSTWFSSPQPVPFPLLPPLHGLPFL